jgi:hypothetical protein
VIKLSANLSVIIIITNHPRKKNLLKPLLTKSEESPTPILAGALRETTKETAIKGAISSIMK